MQTNEHAPQLTPEQVEVLRKEYAFPIESGFPLPEKAIKLPTAPERIRATLKAMDAGQSFIINATGVNHANKISATMNIDLRLRSDSA